MTISISAFFVVLILGIIAIIVNVTKESSNSTFWFLTALWACCLFHLGGPLWVR